MAKQISPVNVWVNGEVKEAEFLNAVGNNLILGTSSQFYWTLYTKRVDEKGEIFQGEQLAQGNLTMDGEDYQQWNQDIFAWDWIAGKLNLTII